MAKPRRAVTIKHVAADAGVSLQTVSRVINKGPGVSPAMAERVQASIDRLGYIPSIAAQRMGGSRSYLIVTLNDRDRTIADWQAGEGSGWLDQMMLGGMLECERRGYRMIVELVDTHSDHVERGLAETLGALRPDGVILTPPHSDNPAIVRLLEDRHIRFARIGSTAPGAGYAITMDDARAARQATAHLLGLGHRRIGFIAGPASYALNAWRIAGWEEAMADAGAGTTDLLARGDFGLASGRAAAGRLLAGAAPPTAIIAGNDRMALGVLDHAQKAGLDVPGDLALVRFDDAPITRFTHPALTAVVQPIAELTALAVQLLIEGDAAGRPDAPAVIPARLAVRASTAPPAPVLRDGCAVRGPDPRQPAAAISPAARVRRP